VILCRRLGEIARHHRVSVARARGALTIDAIVAA
jgi:hypothetical protein